MCWVLLGAGLIAVTVNARIPEVDDREYAKGIGLAVAAAGLATAGPYRLGRRVSGGGARVLTIGVIATLGATAGLLVALFVIGAIIGCAGGDGPCVYD